MKILLPFVCMLLLCSCQKSGDGKAAAATGTGGSLARFAVVGDYLYIADAYGITSYDISHPANPVYHMFTSVGVGIETIFPYQDKLFVGSTQGMFVYSIKKPGEPEKLGQAGHMRSCDPVVADDNYSYVTLRSGSRCGAATPGLYIYDITPIKSPKQESLLQLSDPYGLALRDSVVFVCRDDGLTLVNVKDVEHPKVMYTVAGNHYRDIIPYGNLLICYVTSGLLLFDISNLNQISQVGGVKYQ